MEGQARKSYPSDLSDAQWELIEVLIPPEKSGKQGGWVTLASPVWEHEGTALMGQVCTMSDLTGFLDRSQQRGHGYHFQSCESPRLSPAGSRQATRIAQCQHGSDFGP